jgi:hypothetical protein
MRAGKFEQFGLPEFQVPGDRVDPLAAIEQGNREEDSWAIPCKFPARFNKFPVRRKLIPCFIL